MSKPQLDVLYLGLANGTSLDRANAYRRLGHHVRHIDPRQLLPKSAVVDHITWHVGDNILAPLMRWKLKRALKGQRFDLCHVDSGEWINTPTIKMLKGCATKVINYNIDDPTGHRDVRRFNCYRSSLAEYDLVVVVRAENVAEVQALGARHVLRVFRSADEVTHAPRPLTDEDKKMWDADVLFIGTWMPERGPFLLKLIELGVPLSIRGARWDKAPEWEQLRPFWRGGHIEGDDYAKAIQCAKINLGLLSKGNRDLHTTRSLEIPALGGLLCAERTSEHLSLYDEGKEALYWSSAQECANVCMKAVQHPESLDAIKVAGLIRYETNRLTNEHTINQIISATTT